MKQLPKAIERNGDLWVPAATKHLVFRALQDAREALASIQGLEAMHGKTSITIDHAEQLKALGLVEELLGLGSFGRPLPPVHEQLGEPTARQSRMLRNLFTLAPV